MKLEVSGLSFTYRRQPVLREVSFHLRGGELLSVLGPNGVGKTTLFKCVLGIVNGYEGRVTVEGDDVRRLTPRQMAQRVAYIPQVNRPAFGYTVLDTVLMSTTHSLPPFASPRREQRDIAMDALRHMGVEALAPRNFSLLSGGEQQLVLIARALAQRSGILVMDEPTSSLDYGNQLRVLERVQALAAEGYAVMLSTHNPQHALTFANRLLALQGGRAIAFGDTAKHLTPDLLHTLYGVDAEFVPTRHGCAIAAGVCHTVP